MPRPDDVVGWSADGRRALTEEHRRRAVANAGVLGVAVVVHGLGHHPARRRDRRPQRQPSAGTPPAAAEAAARTAFRPAATNSAVVGSSASMGNASLPRWTYHRLAVRMTLILRSTPCLRSVERHLDVQLDQAPHRATVCHNGNTLRPTCPVCHLLQGPPHKRDRAPYCSVISRAVELHPLPSDMAAPHPAGDPACSFEAQA
jgi:hypothetical protein